MKFTMTSDNTYVHTCVIVCSTYVDRSLYRKKIGGEMGTSRNPGFGCPQFHGEMGLRQVEQGSSFTIFDHFSK